MTARVWRLPLCGVALLLLGANIPFIEDGVDLVFDGAAAVAVGDVDGDGALDVLAAGFNADDVTWWENRNGDGSLWVEHLVDGAFNGASSIAAADLNGDSRLDVLATGFLVDRVTWWQNVTGGGLSWTERTIASSFPGADALVAADLDGDLDLDVLAVAEDDDRVTWWENTAGTGLAWTQRDIDTAFAGATAVAAADIDGNGSLDVLGAAFFDDEIAWWQNTAGNGTAWTRRSIDTAFAGASGVAAGDFDGDGDRDVAGVAFDGDDVSWWENTAGSGLAWTEHLVDGAFNGASSIAAADLDGDGDVDLVAVAFFADDVVWYENANGAGTSWTKRTIDASFDGATAVVTADLDGDTHVDVVAAAENADDVAWWENDSPTCGDVTVDDVIDASDVDRFREALADPAGSPLSFAARQRCTVIEPPSDCDVLDVTVIRRVLASPALPPGVLQVCVAVGP